MNATCLSILYIIFETNKTENETALYCMYLGETLVRNYVLELEQLKIKKCINHNNVNFFAYDIMLNELSSNLNKLGIKTNILLFVY